MEQFKTIILLSLLTILFVFIGSMLGGSGGAMIAFLMAMGMNFFSYFFSDTLVLKHYRAVQVDKNSAKEFYEIVERVAKNAKLPMPKVYIIPDNTPNAFATGRNHTNSAVAATEGLLNLLNREEIEGVMAHEISHVKHYDILIGTITATIAGAIAMIAQFGSSINDNKKVNPIIMIILSIILPMAAMIIQMSISRSREYMADEMAGRITNHPEWLQSALIKLEDFSKNRTLRDATPQTAHMFIVNPFSAKGFSLQNLFSTHPHIRDRVERLEKLKRELR